jgi:esterase/lipase
MDKSQIHFVLVAGFSSDHLEVTELKESLKKKGFSTDVVSFYGEGYKDDFANLKISDCIENLSEFLNQRAKQHEKIFGIGISLGGSLLLEHAKKYDNLNGIVGVGVPFKLRKIKLMHLGQKLLPLILPIWNRLQKIKKLRLSPMGAANVVIEYLEVTAIKNLDYVETPVLFIHSKKDPVSDYRAIPKFFHIISSIQKKIIFFNNGDHVVNHDFNSIVKHTLDFFDIS